MVFNFYLYQYMDSYGDINVQGSSRNVNLTLAFSKRPVKALAACGELSGRLTNRPTSPSVTNLAINVSEFSKIHGIIYLTVPLTSGYFSVKLTSGHFKNLSIL